MNKAEKAHYKGRIILKLGKHFVIKSKSHNRPGRRFPTLLAATTAIDHDRRIKVSVPF